MGAPIYVIGHRSPDTDAIASAIGYAAVLAARGETATPARAGDVRPETAFLLDYFRVPLPELVPDAYLRVRDVMTRPARTVRVDTPIGEVGQTMRELGMRPLPVVDDDGRLCGMVDTRDFARAFITAFAPETSAMIPLSVCNLVRMLDGDLVVSVPGRELHDRVVVGVMALESLPRAVEPGTLLVVGDRTDLQGAAIDLGIGALVVTSNRPLDPAIVAQARERRVTLIRSPHHSYETIRRIHVSVPIHYVMEKEPVVCGPDDRLEDARQALTSARALPVVNADRQVVGIVTRSDLLRAGRRRFALVDHNERRQAIPGIENAEIVAIVDHHRVANLETNAPLTMRLEPLGATSTLVARLAEEAQVSLEPRIAGVLLGGIIADTLMFRSPTTTSHDRETATRLALRAEVDLESFGTRLLEIAGDVSGRSIGELLGLDFKEFSLPDARFGIGVIETTNAPALLAQRVEIQKALRQRRGQDYLCVLFVVVDILREQTTILVEGYPDAVATGLGAKLTDAGLISLNGVCSRKKQIVPRLSAIRDAIGQV